MLHWAEESSWQPTRTAKMACYHAALKQRFSGKMLFYLKNNAVHWNALSTYNKNTWLIVLQETSPTEEQKQKLSKSQGMLIVWYPQITLQGILLKTWQHVMALMAQSIFITGKNSPPTSKSKAWCTIEFYVLYCITFNWQWAAGVPLKLQIGLQGLEQH